MLGCISKDCKFKETCAIYFTKLPKGEVHTLEPLADFGMGSSNSAGTSLEYVCGELGNYGLYIPTIHIEEKLDED